MCVLKMAKRKSDLSDGIVTNERTNNKPGLAIFCTMEQKNLAKSK